MQVKSNVRIKFHLQINNILEDNSMIEALIFNSPPVKLKTDFPLRISVLISAFL